MFGDVLDFNEIDAPKVETDLRAGFKASKDHGGSCHNNDRKA